MLEPLAQELGARSLAVDLARRDDVERLLAEVGHVDLLVANAAVPGSGPLLDYIRRADRPRAAGQPARADGPRAASGGGDGRARSAGHLVFISSLAGKASRAGSSVYSATKFGLRGFGQGLRGDLRGTGVGVRVVFPGLHPRRRDVRRVGGRSCRGFVGTSTPEQVADARGRRDRARPRRGGRRPAAHEARLALLDGRAVAVRARYSAGSAARRSRADLARVRPTSAERGSPPASR